MLRTLTCSLAALLLLTTHGVAGATGDPLGPGLRRLDDVPEPATPSVDRGRDPFRSFLADREVEPRSLIELVPLASLRLRAMLWDVRVPKAVVTLNGSEHVIEPGAKVGREGGVVTEIDGSCVVVEQRHTAGSSDPETVRLCLHFGS